MINVVHINKKPYSFKFGMRMLWQIAGKYDLEFDQIWPEMRKNFDLFLEVVTNANDAAVRKEGSGELITSDELEDAIDDDMLSGEGMIINNLFSAFQTQRAAEDNGQGVKKKTV